MLSPSITQGDTFVLLESDGADRPALAVKKNAPLFLSQPKSLNLITHKHTVNAPSWI